MNVPINNIRYSSVQGGGLATPQPVVPVPFSSVGSLAATLTIASAASIGANMADVQKGAISLPFAILNGVAKGAAASYILSKTTRSTTGEVLVAAGFLAGAAYLIDAKMKKTPVCEAVEGAE